MIWSLRTFESLSASELYEILTLRQRVFVVEQNAAYLDCDGRDDKSTHLLGKTDDTLVAYARLFAPGVAYEEACIGRVVTHPEYRRVGYGRLLMKEAIGHLQKSFPGPIRIGAQFYLVHFYGEFGFVQASDHYDEDGIDHIEMLLR